MKAPDKIYVSIRDLQYGYTTDICLSQEKGYSAYIRKEALLEWINTAKNSLLMDTKAPHLGKVGSLATLDALTDMLNEM